MIKFVKNSNFRLVKNEMAKMASFYFNVEKKRIIYM